MVFKDDVLLQWKYEILYIFSDQDRGSWAMRDLLHKIQGFQCGKFGWLSEAVPTLSRMEAGGGGDQTNTRAFSFFFFLGTMESGDLKKQL